MNIPARLKLVIETSGLTITDVANKCGIPYSSLQNYLRGLREPKADALIAISTHLNISIDWLLTGKGEMRHGSVAPSTALTSREAALLSLFNGLDEDAQREIQHLAEEKKRLRELEAKLRELSEVVGKGNFAG